MSTKKCYTCKIEKPISKFNFRNKAKGIHKGICKDCDKIRQKKYFKLCECGNDKHPQSKLCNICNREKILKESNYENLTLGDKIYSKHKYAKYSYIRYYAREYGLRNFKCCQNCGYDKHIEICHIKPISSFPEETKLTEINSPDNLVALCPNCHWEFDSGLITLSASAR